MPDAVGDDSLLASLRAAVDAAPDDVPLRVHLAELLAGAGERAEAVRQAGAVLQRDPANERALRLIAGGVAQAPADAVDRAAAGPESGADVLEGLEAQLKDVVPPMFVDPDGGAGGAFEAQRAGLRLADVAGMAEVKARLEAAVLAPMRNPELVRLYGKSLRGGLLLYGPPGCGKTFIARALAGEMEARFLPVSLADVLDMFIGQSERNVRGLFEMARRSAPCVVFLDEVDAIGQKRTQLRNSAARGTVNQLLSDQRWTASRLTTKACSFLAQRTIHGTWTSRCAAPAGLTGCCSCCPQTNRHGRRCCGITSATARSRTSTSAGSHGSPMAIRARIWHMSASSRPRRRCLTRLAPEPRD